MAKACGRVLMVCGSIDSVTKVCEASQRAALRRADLFSANASVEKAKKLAGETTNDPRMMRWLDSPAHSIDSYAGRRQ